MSTDFILPDLGEGIHEAELLNVMVKEGDTVTEDQPIFEVETDKAVVEIPSPYAGKIAKIHVQTGQIVTTGSVMVTFEVEGASQEPARGAEKKKSEAAQSKGAAAARVGGMTSETAAAKNGQAGQLAPAAREQHEVLARHGDNQEGAVAHGPGPVPAAPATRRLARELGIDIRQVPGSGSGNRVLDEDVKHFAATGRGRGAGAGASSGTTNGARTAKGGSGNGHDLHTRSEAPSLQAKYGRGKDEEGGHEGGSEFMQLASQPSELPDFAKFGPVERIPLKSLRRKIAINMTQSWTHIPHVTTFDEADITDLDGLRSRYEAEVKKEGGKLTITVLTLKAVVSALKKYPQFNASLDEGTGEIIFKHYYNIGIAVATERGLIVPVIRDVDKKGIIELSSELAQIAEKTRSGKIELDRLQGGTFTITNIGAIGGSGAAPMINYPECAILCMAKASLKPVVKNGTIQPALVLPLSMSFDHRIADGAEAAYFVQQIVRFLQEPFRFVLAQ
jgi:pyruvate dehydrogenase E2 component (dihydrolipoamide acetyltransferase)